MESLIKLKSQCQSLHTACSDCPSKSKENGPRTLELLMGGLQSHLIRETFPEQLG